MFGFRLQRTGLLEIGAIGIFVSTLTATRNPLQRVSEKDFYDDRNTLIARIFKPRDFFSIFHGQIDFSDAERAQYFQSKFET